MICCLRIGKQIFQSIATTAHLKIGFEFNDRVNSDFRIRNFAIYHTPFHHSQRFEFGDGFGIPIVSKVDRDPATPVQSPQYWCDEV